MGFKKVTRNATLNANGKTKGFPSSYNVNAVFLGNEDL